MPRRGLALVLGPLALVVGVAVLAPAPPSRAAYCTAAESAIFEFFTLFESPEWMGAAERLIDEVPSVIDEAPEEVERDWRLILRGVRAIVAGGQPPDTFEQAVVRVRDDFSERCAPGSLLEDAP